MTTIKSYTDLEQSKKLTDILPLESADMHYHYDIEFDELEAIPTITEEDDHFILFPNDVRCWSLAALLKILVNINCIWVGADDVSAWRCIFNLRKGEHHETTEYTTPIDACYKLIIDLHEKNLCNYD